MSYREAESAIAIKRKLASVRRGITRINTKLDGLESSITDPDTAPKLKEVNKKLNALDQEYKALHYELLVLLTEEADEELESNEEKLAEHEDKHSVLSLRIDSLLSKVSAARILPEEEQRKLCMKLHRIKKGLEETETLLNEIESKPERKEIAEAANSRLKDYKQDLDVLLKGILECNLGDDNSLLDEHSKLESAHFDCQCQIAKLAKSVGGSSAARGTGSLSTKLPQMSIPSFDGELTRWQMFWQLFDTSVHSQTSLSNAEKLVYLQHALKDCSAKSLISNMSPSGDQYLEAISCLMERYDRPRVVLQAHVAALVESPSLKDGSSKELRRLYDLWLGHTRALKVLGANLDPIYLTTILQMKLDRATTYEWEKHSKEYTKEIPPVEDLLKFIDFQARALEGSTISKKSVSSGPNTLLYKKPSPTNRIMAHVNAADSSPSQCVLCTKEHHPLYVCTKFRAMSVDDKRSLLKNNHLCFNCLRGGHFTNQCYSSSKCKKCNRPHHTLLHVNDYRSGSNNTSSATEGNHDTSTVSPRVVTNTAAGLRSSALLKTCRIIIFSEDGAAVEARALLDDGSTASFISEKLASGLRLKRSKQRIGISGVT